MARLNVLSADGCAEKPVSPALTNPAVARCCEAGNLAYAEALKDLDLNDLDEDDDDEYEAELCARAAYRKVMPPLVGSANIRDFIACVAQGMLMNIINSTDAPRLLYAAQVASMAQKRSGKNKKKKKSPASAASQSTSAAPSQDAAGTTAQSAPAPPLTPP